MTGTPDRSDSWKDELLPRALNELAHLISISDDPFVLTDADGTIMYANRAPVDPELLTHFVRQQMPRSVLTTPGSKWRGEVSFDIDGDTRTFDVQVVCGDSSAALQARDITAALRLQKQLAHLASHDALTDLANRSHLLRRLAQSVDRARTNHSNVTLLYIDIDDLKRVNDSVGHEIGDALIAAVGQRLTSSVRPEDLVARIGGDEFVVLCEGVDDEASASHMAERVRGSASGRYILPSLDADITVSVGAVMYAAMGESEASASTAESLLRDADKAMYHAKLRGKARSELYTEAMRIAERERTRLAADLEHAVDLEQLFLVHLPIVSPHTHRIVATEALVRWQHPDRGVLQPAAFIDLAEGSGAGRSIGTWVIRSAVDDLRRWIDEGRVDGHFVVHVNVARSHVLAPDFAEVVLDAVSAGSLRPDQIVIEFNEKLVLDDDGRAVRALRSLRRRGVRLCLDDFGAGTSSLTSLTSCPVDYVKLDGTLVRGLGEGGHDEPIVRSVIQLAHGFDASVIAESVSTPLEIERLIALGCDLVQGFHIARPLPAADFAAGTATVFSA
jgi:diguanylate cyclase (GGDEF)-like protein